MVLSDLLNRQHVPYRVADGGQELAICCLFCVFQGEAQDTRFRLYLNVVNGGGFCFNCGWRSRYAVQQVLRRLQLPASDLELETPPEKHFRKPVLPNDYQALWKPVDALDRKALRYVRKRGIPLRQIKEKGLGVSYVGEFAYRVLFPILDNGVLKGLTARAFVGNPKAKYLHVRAEKCIFNIGERKRIVLSEGVFKALRIEQVVQADKYGSGACLGHSLNDTQMDQLRAHKVRKVVLWPDPDPAGRRGFLGVAEKLQQVGMDVEVVWPVTIPADDASTPQLEQAWGARQPFGWHLAEQLKRG